MPPVKVNERSVAPGADRCLASGVDVPWSRATRNLGTSPAAVSAGFRSSCVNLSSHRALRQVYHLASVSASLAGIRNRISFYSRGAGAQCNLIKRPFIEIKGHRDKYTAQTLQLSGLMATQARFQAVDIAMNASSLSPTVLAWGTFLDGEPPMNASNQSGDPLSRPSHAEDDLEVNTDIYSKVLVTIIYLGLFIVGTTGNTITAYTLARKRSLQNLQSTVHYHLGSLALSDLLILILGMPVELYNFIWVHHPWAFGNAACKGYYFLRDACTYATALNIASLSVERYMAICHPFKAKSIMSRSRTKKLITFIWVASLLLALPMVFIMGEVYGSADRDPDSLICTNIVKTSTFKTVIQVNAFLSFVFPMVVISVLNSIIANQLIIMFKQAHQESQVCTIGGQQTVLSMSVEPSRVQSLKHGVRVLRAVVIAFVVCWLPYHIRRLMYCYVPEDQWTDFLYDFYHYFYMLTNVLFYVSSTINPILYNLVSANFRQIFVSTLSFLCLPWRKKKKRPTFTRKSNSISSTIHTFSSQITRETPY
ncbi:neurotensin receptor type 1 [Ambystoma mexicanum]|uniref:neurotensin receptor type 1 n=1 Tax=Ambystoma mexicanum TaxID=8296 RepID=UPI0037E7DF32